MHNLRPRIIARLDIKNEYVIKGIHLEGLRKVGEPLDLASRYYEEGIDEILFMDSVASLYDRNSLYGLIEKAASRSFIPKTLGGGIRSVDDVLKAFDSGADKVLINTAAGEDLSIINRIASRFGSQAMVASIQAKRESAGTWQAYIDNGREPTGIDVLKWVQTLISEGAGEIAITSVDNEGTQRGFDLDLATCVDRVSTVPIIVSGGCGSIQHVIDLIRSATPSGVAIASCFHYNKFKPSDLHKIL